MRDWRWTICGIVRPGLRRSKALCGSPSRFLVDRSRLAVHIIHKKIIPKRVRSREVSLTPAHLGYFLNELNQPIIACEHKSIDQNSAFLAARDFFQRLADHQRIQPKRVLVDAAILQRERAMASHR